jgi:sialate O-acetylesterase
MIHPLVPLSMRGILWYQGESNHNEGMLYVDKTRALVQGWRKAFQQEDLAYYYVQIAPYQYGNEDPTIVARFWEAQAAAMAIPNSGMVVTTDIGDVKDIHPVNKQEVGRRLALWALAKDYGKVSTIPSGPLYRNSTIQGDKVRIQFDHTGTGLKTRDGGELKHFQITGANKTWVWAKAKIEGNEIVVWHDEVKQPVGVRYAWAAWPQGANLINAEGLPASCFRTDDFLPSTLGVTSPFKEATAVAP